MLKSLATALFLISSLATTSFAQTLEVADSQNVMDELNPFDPNIEKTLEEMDQLYFDETGSSPFIENLIGPMGPSCYRSSCKVWAQVSRSQQKMYLHIDGIHTYTWAVSTGAPGHGTPNFDTHPNGRIYDKYTSTKYPGGDYQGLGNMPYAVFISGGFAIHGTGTSNWKKLGTKASHGCIRVHPDNAYVFNRLVRQHGIYKTWITVHE
ncbi:L,D-transpeptidase [Bdellovibrio sp. ArHS]|uniref:L,D-transpeptidase n=1 Tax=Bdellovibrio sp. ArHS TaxID=1569284 RepID=UPI000ACF9681|nr:L,D-transpeptidase [Bdellovibrio sp. ArHS]